MPPEVREQLCRTAEEHGKAVLVAAVFDTIKRVDDGVVVETIDRSKLRWPRAWACTADHEPEADPPPAQWFEGAAVIEADSSRG